MRKPAIPDVPMTTDRARSQFDRSVKDLLEVLTGRRGGRIKPLDRSASTEAIIAKINEIIDLLHG